MTTKSETEVIRTKITAIMLDNEGDMFCLSCKRQFGVIGTSNILPIADSNFCPHCGAKIIAHYEIEMGKSIEEFVEICEQ